MVSTLYQTISTLENCISGLRNPISALESGALAINLPVGVSDADYEINPLSSAPVLRFQIVHEIEELPIFDESSNEDYGDVPIWDKFEEELGNEGLEHVGGNNEEQEMPILVSNEPCLLNWEDSQQVQEWNGVNVALSVLPITNELFSSNWLLTFTRKECDRLIEIIKSRVIDGITMEEEKDGTLGGIPNRTIGDVTPELCSKAVMEAKQWLEEKKVASSSKSGMDRGTCTLSSVARSQVVIIFYDLLLPPYFILVEHSGSRCGIGSGGDKYPKQKVYSLSSGSWNIQEEIRRVRSKATEDMLKTSARIDLPSYAWERKSLDEPLLADKKDWEGGAKVHNFDLFPATGSISASLELAAGAITNCGLPASALELTHNISWEEDFTSQPIFSSSAQIQDLEGIQPVEGEGHAGSNSRLPTIPDPAVEHDSRTYSADKEETELRGNPNTNGFCISGSSFGAGDDEQTLRSSHDPSPKPVGSNLDNLVNIVPMEETCELLSEASMEVPVINETNSSAAAGGSQGSCTMQCEELSHELSQPNLGDSLVGKTGTTVEKQQGRKLSSRYNRKSRGKR
ncbi:hypothetical protein RHMOL_Rhmol09G0079100 [Rhododendron molle]|uniref:Uncharacterized protein n=1 Tax=Rhododendron molle TaxID=49168 RepID=A0ACC0MB01_RHOML|nr:hypothetical protein RHMOL_Rhmol09G0079100 [Rhododendron molle]